MNTLVTSEFVEKDPIELINNDVSFFKQFTVIVATQIPEEQLRILAKFAYENNIALFVVRAYGLIGYLRVVVPEHTSKFFIPLMLQSLR